MLGLWAVTANAAQLQCEFSLNTTLPFNGYICEGKITTSTTDYFVDGVTGNHVSGKGNDDITHVTFKNTGVTVLPKNLNVWFKNFFELSIVDLSNYPNFRRSEFYDFTRLKTFYASKLPLVTRIPRDTFWDLIKLKYLMLEEMPNMENFDVDMLKNLPVLELFSAKGPSKINQISPGFFRNQMESLKEVIFLNTNLVRVGHSVFVNLQVFIGADFTNAGCLNGQYNRESLTTAIRAKCQDMILQENSILKKYAVMSSDSSE